MVDFDPKYNGLSFWHSRDTATYGEAVNMEQVLTAADGNAVLVAPAGESN